MDDEGTADRFEEWLSPTYDVLTASEGEDALAAIDESVDVILLDQAIPGIEGDHVFVTLRDRGFDCRVALVSERIDRGLDMGFDAYVEKPVTRAELDATVSSLCSRNSRDAIQRQLSSKRIERNVRLAESDARSVETDPQLQRLEREIDRLERELDDVTPR